MGRAAVWRLGGERREGRGGRGEEGGKGREEDGQGWTLITPACLVQSCGEYTAWVSVYTTSVSLCVRERETERQRDRLRIASLGPVGRVCECAC